MFAPQSLSANFLLSGFHLRLQILACGILIQTNGQEALAVSDMALCSLVLGDFFVIYAELYF